MILVLNILNKNSGSYLGIEDGDISIHHDFDLEVGKESILKELDIFIKNNKLELKDFKGLILLVKESSLTQVKVIVTIINTLGWDFNIPVVGKFYFKEDYKEILPDLIKEIDGSKEFKELKIEYKQKPNITLSKNKSKYTIE